MVQVLKVLLEFRRTNLASRDGGGSGGGGGGGAGCCPRECFPPEPSRETEFPSLSRGLFLQIS
jgi:hypothetical protein